MWKNSLNNVESDNNKILYETLFDFFKRNGNKSRICNIYVCIYIYIYIYIYICLPDFINSKTFLSQVRQ